MSEKRVYRKCVLKGNNYEVGRKQGESVRLHEPETYGWLTSPFTLPDGSALPELTVEEAEKKCDLFNSYDSGLGDEVRGLAAGLQVPVNRLHRLLYGGFGEKQPCACSVMGIKGGLTENGHAYIGQSYEFGYEDEYTYIAMQTPGNYSHMGFVFYQVGRFDGMNEKGLCIGITCLDFTTPSVGQKEGFTFSFLVRILLDTCATTKEAVDKLNTLPICTNANLIIGDRTGDIVVAEILTADGKSDIAIRKAKPYVYGFNHFLAEEHKKLFPQKRNFSYFRELCLSKRLSNRDKDDASKLNVNDIKKILRTKLPEGLCCHAYREYFGTLRSMFYDLTDSSVYIAFGSPQNVDFVRLTLETELSNESDCVLIPVEFENENVDMKFWELAE